CLEQGNGIQQALVEVARIKHADLEIRRLRVVAIVAEQQRRRRRRAQRYVRQASFQVSGAAAGNLRDRGKKQRLAAASPDDVQQDRLVERGAHALVDGIDVRRDISESNTARQQYRHDTDCSNAQDNATL